MVLGAPAVSVRAGEAGEEEARSCVPDIGGPGRAVLRENPGGVGPRRGPVGARTLRRGWVTYVCSGGQDEAISRIQVQSYSWVSSSFNNSRKYGISLCLGVTKVGKKLEVRGGR